MSASRADRQPIRHQPTPRLQRHPCSPRWPSPLRHRNRTVHPKNNDPLDAKSKRRQPRMNRASDRRSLPRQATTFQISGSLRTGAKATSGYRGSYNKHAASGQPPYENAADPRSRDAKPEIHKTIPISTSECTTRNHPLNACASAAALCANESFCEPTPSGREAQIIGAI